MAGKRGVRVVLVSRNGAALAEIEQQIITEGGRATHVVADVSRRENLDKVALHATETYGGFDTWVNNAGVGIVGRIDQVTDEGHRQLFDVNFWGLVYGMTIAAKHLKNKGGAIIDLGSIASEIGLPLQGMYGASKHAIKGITDAFRMELELEGSPISLTLIKPASINTPFPRHAKNYLDQEIKLPPPIYRPEDVADAVLFAAEHGGRDYFVGGGGKLMSEANTHLPHLVDWAGAHVVAKQTVRNTPAHEKRAGSLWPPARTERFMATLLIT
jgi:short-subunit dehydrogenase